MSSGILSAFLVVPFATVTVTPLGTVLSQPVPSVYVYVVLAPPLSIVNAKVPTLSPCFLPVGSVTLSIAGAAVILNLRVSAKS